MDYRIDLFDTWGRRVGIFLEIPVLEVTATLVDGVHRIRGILPQTGAPIDHGYTIQVWIDGELFARANITSMNPTHSDTRRLILERYVHFHEFVSFEAEWRYDDANRRVNISHVAETVSDAVKRSINNTLGPIHYGVAHNAHPEGGIREYNKFIARKTVQNELETAGINSGQWVDSTRIDLTNAYAKDGDTIAGLRVDGVDWPDLRLMMIDTEETSINSHAISRHPEVADWTAAQYDLSIFKYKADQAKDLLDAWISLFGIDYIELNPHLGADGTFDDRIDAYGRYLGLVHGNSRCYNAQLVELGWADVYLYDDGRGHVPEMEFKDFFSYAKTQVDTIETAAASVAQADANIDVFE